VISAGEACDTVQLLQAYTRQHDPQRQHGAFYFSTMLGGQPDDVLSTKTVVEVIDTTEQAQLPALRRISYKEADLYAIVYSVMEPEALDEVQRQWIPELQMHGEPGRPLVLIGMHAHKRPSRSREASSAHIPQGEVQKWLSEQKLNNDITALECQGDMGSVRKAFDECAQRASASHKASGTAQLQYAGEDRSASLHQTQPPQLAPMTASLRSNQYDPTAKFDPDLNELWMQHQPKEESRFCDTCSVQ
jgi:hypothetical protein